jgi:hypothetical protein
MINMNMNIQLTITEVLEKLSSILQKYPDMDEKKIDLIKSELILSITYNKKEIDNKCKGTYKSGSKKGIRCETIVINEDYCKKHKPNNKMGSWAKSRSINN